MIPVPKAHSYTKEFKRMFRHALFIVDSEDKRRVTEVVESKFGKSFDEMMLSQPDWILKRVKKTVPLHYELLPVVQLLFDECTKWVDPRTHLPLFDLACLKSCKAVLKQIEQGHVSDPVGIQLYRKIKTDKYGLSVYRCLRGTSSVEGGVHQNIIRKFGFFNSSPELANCALAEYRMRHNTEVGIRNRYGVNPFGHHDPWLTQFINKLKMDLGHSFQGSYHDPDSSSLMYKDGNKTFGICHLPLDLANEYQMEPYPLSPLPTDYSSRESVQQICILPCVKLHKDENSAYEYLAKRQNVALAVVPNVSITEQRVSTKVTNASSMSAVETATSPVNRPEVNPLEEHHS
ncbi:hypothetical protein BDB01DRAFT_850553 [Pilobolus umbonatus]|nr:hypothetical protein BDB01DRAFT_850553 [Pilobolus umbonatus]